jgi:hypothetical protein
MLLALALIGIAACSEEERQASVVPEAYAATPAPQSDYGWRTSISPTAEPGGQVYEYQ